MTKLTYDGVIKAIEYYEEQFGALPPNIALNPKTFSRLKKECGVDYIKDDPSKRWEIYGVGVLLRDDIAQEVCYVGLKA